MSQNKHPLIQRAKTYPLRNVDLAPHGCEYDDIAGAWRVIASGELWVETSARQGTATKKFAMETGEDQDGD